MTFGRPCQGRHGGRRAANVVLVRLSQCGVAECPTGSEETHLRWGTVWLRTHDPWSTGARKGRTLPDVALVASAYRFVATKLVLAVNLVQHHCVRFGNIEGAR
jgi:hypothetical protein